MSSFAYPLLIVMVIGAVFAGINTMYGAVAARTREDRHGTRAAVSTRHRLHSSVVVERYCSPCSAASLVSAIIYLALDGLQANSNFLTSTQYAFTFAVSTEVMSQGVLWAIAIGLVGGLFPALRAAAWWCAALSRS